MTCACMCVRAFVNECVRACACMHACGDVHLCFYACTMQWPAGARSTRMSFLSAACRCVSFMIRTPAQATYNMRDATIQQRAYRWPRTGQSQHAACERPAGARAS